MSQASCTSDGWLSKEDFCRFSGGPDIELPGLPAGGLSGEFLVKLSDLDYDAGWTDFTLADVARLSLPNVFKQPNTFSGIRLGQIRIITAADSPYPIQPTDGVILADTTFGDVVAFLPQSMGDGQLLRLRKIDQTDGQFRIYAADGDLIDLDSMISTSEFKRGFVIEDGQQGFWDVVVPGDVVNTTVTNEFTNVTIFHGVQFVPKLITDDYEIQPDDTFLVIDCSLLNKDIMITLLQAVGSGQLLHIKKIDNTGHVAQIVCQGGDFVGDFPGDAISINLVLRGDDCTLSDDLPGFWDNWGPSLEGEMPAGGTTGQILAKRSNDDYDVQWVNQYVATVSARPTTLNEVITAGVTLGLWP